MTASSNTASGIRTFAADVSAGFLAITRNSFAFLGLSVAFIALTLLARPDLRQTGEEQLMGWLQSRQVVDVADVVTTSEPMPSERTMAIYLKDLPKEQAAVAHWLSKKYKVAPEALGLLVSEAYSTGSRVKLDPTLILAVMAIESRFNPYAQSPVGAQGLMQVMTRIHTDKYQKVGGHLAAFDPVTNLRVGVRVLQECIARAGSLEGGLRYYVGAANLPSDGGYAAKVLAEHFRLRQVAGMRAAPEKPAPVLVTTTEPASSAPAVEAPAALPVTTSDKVALLSDV